MPIMEMAESSFLGLYFLMEDLTMVFPSSGSPDKSGFDGADQRESSMI